MDLRQIQYFACLYEDGKVTTAARRLNVVQPALSMQIAKLEDEIGQKLFERTSQGMVPTAAGRTMFRLFQPILRDFAVAKQEMARLNNEVAGDLSVGLLESVAHGVLSAVVAEFTERYPRVSLRVTLGYTGSFIDQVTAGQLDIALINRPRKRLTLNAQEMLNEEMVVLSSTAHPHDLGPSVTLADLPAQRLILPSKHHGLRVIVDRLAQAEETELAPAIEVDSLSTIVDLVAGGAWVSILPPIALHHGLANGSLRVHRLTRPRMKRTLAWIHHPRRPLSAAADKFMEVVSGHARRAASEASAEAQIPDDISESNIPDK